MKTSSRFTLLLAAGLLSNLTLVGCGGKSIVEPSSTTSPAANKAPTASLTASAPAGLMSITKLTFKAVASDPDGDALTYEWNLGDGTTATGPSVEKVYDRAGTYNVAVKVTDSRGASASANATVTVKSLDGFWRDADQGYGIEIIQKGDLFTGRTVFNIQDLTGALKGEITAGLDAHYRTSYFGGAVTDDFVGKLDANLDVFTGILNLSDGRSNFQFRMNMVRQK